MTKGSEQTQITNLLNDIGAEFLDRQRADIACELADDGIAEAVVVQIKDVLHDLQRNRVSGRSDTALRGRGLT